jgi:mono/diheme cytochrome c family protein
MIKTSLLALSLCLGSLFVACAAGTPESTTPIGISAPPKTPPGEPTPPATPPAVASAAPAGAAPAANVWRDDFTTDQAVAFMKANVVPHMGPVFQAANAKRYADFSCKTCHGPNGKRPTEFLPHLTMKDGHMLEFVQNPEVSKFMASRVVPEMASSLGMAAYDPATKTGFGCGGCHTVDMK